MCRAWKRKSRFTVQGKLETSTPGSQIGAGGTATSSSRTRPTRSRSSERAFLVLDARRTMARKHSSPSRASSHPPTSRAPRLSRPSAVPTSCRAVPTYLAHPHGLLHLGSPTTGSSRPRERRRRGDKEPRTGAPSPSLLNDFLLLCFLFLFFCFAMKSGQK